VVSQKNKMDDKPWYQITEYGGRYETIFKKRTMWESIGYTVTEEDDHVTIKKI
jgi:hypothetical protein